MKAFVFIIIFLFFSIIVYAQHINQIATDEKSGKPMLIGEFKKEILQNDTSFSWWFESEYESYEPEDSILKLINLDSVKIVCVMGTWCSDSRREVPRFIKILDELKFDYKNLSLYAVDRNKKAPDVNIDDFVIERVATFIFYKNDSELGRIIETPKVSLEADLLEILSQ